MPIRRAQPSDISSLRRNPVDTKARSVAEPIVDAIRKEGEAALRRYGEQFGELKPGDPLLLTRDVELKAAYAHDTDWCVAGHIVAQDRLALDGADMHMLSDDADDLVSATASGSAAAPSTVAPTVATTTF